MTELIRKLKLYGPGKFLLFAFNELRYILFSQYFLGSYSQNQEDLVIYKLLNNKQRGFYVDVGAYDPIRFSNTKFFYRRGWSGINVEPDTQKYQNFLRSRPKDVNLNLGIGLVPGKLTFYKFLPDSLSTFSKNQAVLYKKMGFKVVGKSVLPIERLGKVLSQNAKKKRIDFLSIDTEGFEMEVLNSNNWKKFKPRIICIESYTFNSAYSPSTNNKQSISVERTEIRDLLTRLGYKKVHVNSTNIIYRLAPRTMRSI